MTLSVCPADTVRAPVERVWELLMQPANYGSFWDLTVERVEPEGPATVGQKFVGWSRALCRRWRVSGELPVLHSRAGKRGPAASRRRLDRRASVPTG